MSDTCFLPRVQTGVTFQRELSHTLWCEAMPLFEAHHREQEHDQDIPLDINMIGYDTAEQIGILRVYTARLDGVLIGYAVFCVLPSLRHQTSLQANQDSFYLVPDQRKGTTGIRFLNYVESRLDDEGVQVIHQHAHPGTVFGKILQRRGYTLVHEEYEKRLDKE